MTARISDPPRDVGSAELDLPSPGRLEYALESPLRLELVAELMAEGDEGLTLEEAVLRSGRHVEDVTACLRPMVSWGIVERLEEGARYRLVPGLPAELVDIVRAAMDRGAERLGRERHVRTHLLGRMIGRDPKMQLVFELVRQVARIDVSVLITGETGTGKELVARSVHDMSRRRGRYFGAVNCAALPEALFESQVFGHARGAFTGAVRDHRGLIEECDGGTLFLDEVGELSVANQVKLLRVLQEGTYTRLGETQGRTSDFRLICATNRDLLAMAGAGSFREDLYYRLNVFPIRLPSLRERLDDLPILVEGIVRSQMHRFPDRTRPAAITPRALERLRAYHWPGNVRELENVVTRSLIFASGGDIDVEHLPQLEGRPVEGGGAQPEVDKSLAQVEREHIVRVLSRYDGNITQAAKVLMISRTTLYKKIRDHDIGPQDGLASR